MKLFFCLRQYKLKQPFCVFTVFGGRSCCSGNRVRLRHHINDKNAGRTQVNCVVDPCVTLAEHSQAVHDDEQYLSHDKSNIPLPSLGTANLSTITTVSSFGTARVSFLSSLQSALTSETSDWQVVMKSLLCTKHSQYFHLVCATNYNWTYSL